MVGFGTEDGEHKLWRLGNTDTYLKMNESVLVKRNKRSKAQSLLTLPALDPVDDTDSTVLVSSARLLAVRAQLFSSGSCIFVVLIVLITLIVISINSRNKTKSEDLPDWRIPLSSPGLRRERLRGNLRLSGVSRTYKGTEDYHQEGQHQHCY